MDFAFYQNGYVYHTKFDGFENIKPGTFQRVGDNLLELVKALSNSEDLPNASLENKEKTVYFDYLGFFMLNYSTYISKFITYGAAVVGLLISGKCLWDLTQGELIY